MSPVPALAIGACEATPMEMVSSYSVFANHGIRALPYCIEKITDKNGRILEEHTIEEEEVLSEATAYLMTSLLRSVVCCGTGASIPGLGFTRPAAGKTGTTNNYSDAWFVGFSPQVACVVWTGVDERRSLGTGVTGTLAAIPVWVKTMLTLHRGIKPTDFRMPDTGIKSEQICEESHQLATSKCPEKVSELFLTETEIDTCTIHGNRGGGKNFMRIFSDPGIQKQKVKGGEPKKKRSLMF
jgi:penicillin-binding protein 1A